MCRMVLYFLTDIGGIWHVREQGEAVWRPVAKNCRSVREASRIVKQGDPRAMVAVVPRLTGSDAGSMAG